MADLLLNASQLGRVAAAKRNDLNDELIDQPSVVYDRTRDSLNNCQQSRFKPHAICRRSNNTLEGSSAIAEKLATNRSRAEQLVEGIDFRRHPIGRAHV